MSIPSLLGWLTVLLGIPLNVYVTWRLWRLHRAAPSIRTLRERGIAATAVLLLTIVFGAVFISNDWVPPLLPAEATRLITRTILLGVAIIPALYWLMLYRGIK